MSPEELTRLRRLDRWLQSRLDRDMCPQVPDDHEAEAEQLLALAGQTVAALEDSPVGDSLWMSGVVAEVAETGEIGPGSRVGPFAIEHALGAGGMGAVYVARRVEGGFEQRVALKVMAGARPDEAGLKQFQRERNALSRLEHPSIARLIDGGLTDDWRPWFAMELVDGRPIDHHADEKRLNVDERLELFVQVCEAVACAHEQLVLHRDIKPSNILVTESGQVKLLDFGLASIRESLDGDESEQTGTVSRWMTPGYASPEQVLGRPVSVASEVYQLGLLLYRLLCGCNPQDLKTTSPAELVEVVCERDPELPSRCWQADSHEAGLRSISLRARPESLARRLCGDLDNIILTALAREPANRYRSVIELAADLRRHLDHLPVRARAATRRYRFAKFLRRHRLAVAATGTIAALVLGSLLVISLQARDLAVERNQALASAERNERLIEVLTGMVRASDVEDGGIEQVTTVGERLYQYLAHVRQELADEPAARLRLLEVLGETFEGLRHFPAVVDAFDEAHGLARAEYGPDDERTLELKLRLASALTYAREWERAEVLLDETEAAYRRLHGEVSEPLAHALYQRGFLYLVHSGSDDPRRQQAIEWLEQALAMWHRLRDIPDREIARTLHHLGRAQPEPEVGMEQMQQALAMKRELLGDDHPVLARRLNDVAIANFRLGRLDQALGMMSQVYQAHVEAYGETHPQSLYALNNLAALMRHAERYDEAIEHYHEAIELTRLTIDEDNIDIAFPVYGLGATLLETGRFSDSLPWLKEAARLAALHEWGREPEIRESLARALAELDRVDEAIAAQHQAVRLHLERYGEDHDRTRQVQERLEQLLAIQAEPSG